MALDFASDRICDNESFVLKAIEKDIDALQFASSRLRDDNIFV